MFASLICLVTLAAGSQAKAANGPPLLLSQPTSTRALALESLCFTQEPFATTSPCAWGADRQTRVMLFALNLTLQPGEAASAVTADVEDASHQHHNLTVEYVGPMPNQEWLTVVIVKLKDELRGLGDVLVRLSYNGGSNRVRFAMGQIGGGPADDPGAVPTLAPPYTISGQLSSSTGQSLGGVTVNLNGPETASTVTTSNGSYSFVVNKVGDYTITPVTNAYYTFAPQTLNYVHENKTANFAGTLRFYQISGRLTVASVPTAGVVVALTGSQTAQTITNQNGDYSFSLPAGGSYNITPQLQYYDFMPGSLVVSDLTGDRADSDFNGTRQTFSIGGKLTGQGGVLAGIVINVDGIQHGSLTTDENGDYRFNGLLAGYDFTVTAITNAYYTFSSKTFPGLSANQTANFAGNIRHYTVSGSVHLGPNAASTFPLQITGSQTTTVTTDPDGNFAISLPAGGNYTFTPSLTYYEFAPANQIVSDLTSDRGIGIFLGTRQTFTISGKAINRDGTALAGIILELAGAPEPRICLTDSAGRYQFPDLTAGYNYTITPDSNSSYFFTPQNFTDLRSNQIFDFTGLRLLQLHGTVRDSQGNGLIGVRIHLSGTDNTIAITAADGSYSLTATETGNYTVLPAVGQGWYLFSPASQQFNNLLSSQLIDFSASLAPIPTTANVLEFNGQPMTVDYGNFWTEGHDLGHFFWEFWAMPGTDAGATYMLSDGYGGAHALLFGVGSFNSSEPNRYELLGNLYDGVRFDNYFGSDVGPAIGEWGHFAVGWDGHNIVTYFDGVPVGKTPFAGPRLTPGPGGGGGRLLIGGSDHSNFDGRIAQVRGFEASNPREQAPGGAETSFAPQTVFGLEGNLLSYYFRFGATVADLSSGYNGANHEGLPRGTLAGILFDCGPCPPPQFVVDPTAPNFATSVPQPPVNVPTPLVPPAQALVFDSFSRANSTYVFGGLGGLGATESGTEGAKAWQTNHAAGTPQPFGVLNSRAVLLGDSTAVAWVPIASSTADLQIRVDRYVGRWGSGIHTGLSFRVQDANNFFFAYTRDAVSGQGKVLDAGYYQNGNRVDLIRDASIPVAWSSLSAVTRTSGAIQIFIDGTMIYSTNETWLASATGSGLYSDSTGKGLVNRWDNFVVFPAPEGGVQVRAIAQRATGKERSK